LKKLNQIKAFYQTRPESLTPFAVLDAKRQWSKTPAAIQMSTTNKGAYWGTMKGFNALASLAHSLLTLMTHGVRLFYDRMVHLRDEDSSSDAYRAIKSERKYRDLMDRGAEIVSDPTFSGHPKMDYMINVVLKHFTEVDETEKRETRIIVFTSYRDSGEEVCRFLKRQEPIIKPHVFVGQKGGTKSEGMTQKQQLDVFAIPCSAMISC
jgi:ATP-dependent DNA helicase MPH1